MIQNQTQNKAISFLTYITPVCSVTNHQWCETSSWINRSFLVEKSTGGNCSMRMLKQKCLAAVGFDPTTFGWLCTIPSLCMIHDVSSRAVLWAQHASSAPRSILHSPHWHRWYSSCLYATSTECQLYLWVCVFRWSLESSYRSSYTNTHMSSRTPTIEYIYLLNVFEKWPKLWEWWKEKAMCLNKV